MRPGYRSNELSKKGVPVFFRCDCHKTILLLFPPFAYRYGLEPLKENLTYPNTTTSILHSFTPPPSTPLWYSVRMRGGYISGMHLGICRWCIGLR